MRNLGIMRASRSGNRSLRQVKGGKSGLQRAECQVTPGRRESMESATENIPPSD
jgi:hypothetical protein